MPWVGLLPMALPVVVPMALPVLAAAMAALLAQPFRGLRWRGWRVLLMLLAPVAVLALLAAARLLAAPAAASPMVAGVLLVVQTLLMLPLTLLAAMLMAREADQPALYRALAAVGVAPGQLHWRVAVPALLPGLVLGWGVACVAGLAASMQGTGP